MFGEKMLSTHFLNYGIILFYIGERLLELSVNQINKRFLINKYFARIRFPKESFQMKLFHSAWLASLILETSWHGKLLFGFPLYLSSAILLIAQILRWYAILTLGHYWSVDIYQMKEHPIIDKGPYVYLRHPNYLAVMLEFIFLPLLLGCFVTLVVGFILNLFILKRRIRLEEEALEEQSHHYASIFGEKKWFFFRKHS